MNFSINSERCRVRGFYCLRWLKPATNSGASLKKVLVGLVIGVIFWSRPAAGLRLRQPGSERFYSVVQYRR